MYDQSDILRLKQRPGLHGALCTGCDYLFDAHDTPSRLGDVVMQLKTIECPRCETRKNLLLLMPFKYMMLMEHRVAIEIKRENVRQTADKYIPRN